MIFDVSSNFQSADLTNANLEGANLEGANLKVKTFLDSDYQHVSFFVIFKLLPFSSNETLNFDHGPGFSFNTFLSSLNSPGHLLVSVFYEWLKK